MTWKKKNQLKACSSIFPLQDGTTSPLYLLVGSILVATEVGATPITFAKTFGFIFGNESLSFICVAIHWNHMLNDQGRAAWMQKDLLCLFQALNLWTFHLKICLKCHFSVLKCHVGRCVLSWPDLFQIPESVLTHFKHGLLPLIILYFFSLHSSHFYNAYTSVLPLHCRAFSFSSETITFSFPQFNYFHCSETRARGLACLLLFIHRQSFSWWHTLPPITTEDKKIVFPS